MLATPTKTTGIKADDDTSTAAKTDGCAHLIGFDIRAFPSPFRFCCHQPPESETAEFLVSTECME